MFGRTFQPSGLPRAYRRVAWLQSDGTAYINLAYAPMNEWAWNNASNAITGTRFTLKARYPNTSGARPGVMIGCQNSLALATAYRWKNKVADSGTCQSRFDQNYNFYWTVNYSRDATGAYSGTFTSPYGASYAIKSDGTCQYLDWDDYQGVYYTTDVTPTYPAQADDPNPTFDRPALSFQMNDATSTDDYTGMASQTFYSDNMVSLFFQGVKTTYGFESYTRKVRVTIETTEYDIGSDVRYSRLEDGTLFLFCTNAGGAPTNFDTNVKIDSLVISECREFSNVSLPVVISTIRNLVACVRKRDEKPGFYDLQNHLFFTNAADSGEFTFADLTA